MKFSIMPNSRSRFDCYGKKSFRCIIITVVIITSHKIIIMINNIIGIMTDGIIHIECNFKAFYERPSSSTHHHHHVDIIIIEMIIIIDNIIMVYCVQQYCLWATTSERFAMVKRLEQSISHHNPYFYSNYLHYQKPT